jgi:hypothetical protein
VKLLAEVLAGLVACGAAYYLARPDGPDTASRRDQTNVGRSIAAPEPTRVDHPDVRTAAGSFSVAERPPAIETPPTRIVRAADAHSSAEEQRAMATLRNEVIVAVSADMQRRGADVMSCLADVELAGVEKLRFSVDVVSTANEATTGQWRFVEIVDGEPLAVSFGACAARALGGGQRVVPPKDFRFPSYRGDLEILYTIPAPPPDSTQ